VRYERTDVAGFTILHHFSRRVSLEELSGYDAGEPHDLENRDETTEDPTS
jgi:hypothetical protein